MTNDQPAPRLGAASVTVSISDADGFRVVHGDGTVLRHVPPEQLLPGDWDAFWNGIHAVEARAAMRGVQRETEAVPAE
jgi:hypothetical protein